MLNRLVLPVGIIAALLIIASLVGPAFAEEGTYELVQTTDHYQITLELGPVTSIMLPDRVSGAQEGIVVVNTNSIPMELGDLMPTIDQGQAVKRLLEVFVHDKETGTLLTDLIPRVVIIDQATEWSRGLPSLTKMYHVQDGPSKSCFGTSIYLNGTYQVTVTIKGEAAAFEGITVAGSSMPPSASEESEENSDN